jgi:hypothetical protein
MQFWRNPGNHGRHFLSGRSIPFQTCLLPLPLKDEVATSLRCLGLSGHNQKEVEDRGPGRAISPKGRMGVRVDHLADRVRALDLWIRDMVTLERLPTLISRHWLLSRAHRQSVFLPSAPPLLRLRRAHHS